MPVSYTHLDVYKRQQFLLHTVPEDEIDRILGQPGIELDYEFLGFTEVYGAVLSFVPKHYTIVDLGCYVAAQAYLFADYEKYIGVDTVSYTHLDVYKRQI